MLSLSQGTRIPLADAFLWQLQIRALKNGIHPNFEVGYADL